ncbi:MAG: FMN-binding protein [Candidatus Sericytochromatia bacterium]|nr:FMN-binding protein [Candidatus Sericytochromatia bacterium]
MWKKLNRLGLCLLLALGSGEIAPVQAAEKPEFYEQIYLSEAEALKLVMGDLNLKKTIFKPTAAQRKRLQQKMRRKLPESEIPIWVGFKQGKPARYAFILHEDGKHYPITFIVGLTPDGKVTQVAVMVYREKRGDGVKRARFLNQFPGKTRRDDVEVNADIIHITGSTISSWSMAAGVRKALILHEELGLK